MGNYEELICDSCKESFTGLDTKRFSTLEKTLCVKCQLKRIGIDIDKMEKANLLPYYGNRLN